MSRCGFFLGFLVAKLAAALGSVIVIVSLLLLLLLLFFLFVVSLVSISCGFSSLLLLLHLFMTRFSCGVFSFPISLVVFFLYASTSATLLRSDSQFKLIVYFGFCFCFLLFTDILS